MIKCKYKNSTMILVDGLEYSKIITNVEKQPKIINLLKNELVIFKDHPKNGFGFIEQKNLEII